jgi:large subunit ribosomal protein L6
MSRIGRKSITIPTGVTVSVDGKTVVVRGTKGELQTKILPNIKVVVAEGEVQVSRSKEDRQSRASHGLIRSLIQNNITGVTEGFTRTLKLVGTGYRAQSKGQGVSLSLGFSHPVDVVPSKGVMLKLEGTDTIHIEGIDKHAVGQVAANIRKLRPPEPYKGKGIRYLDEVVRTKAGKTSAK